VSQDVVAKLNNFGVSPPALAGLSSDAHFLNSMFHFCKRSSHLKPFLRYSTVRDRQHTLAVP